MIDPNPELEPWSLDAGPTLPSHYLTPAEQKRTGHLFKGCPNPSQPADRKAEGAEPCQVCLLVKAACAEEVNMWRAIQEQKARSWREGVTVKPAKVAEPEPVRAAEPELPSTPLPTARMATEKQVGFLVKLASEKRPQWVNEVGVEVVTERARKLTAKQASERIEALMKEPTIAPAQQMKRGAVKAGFYAIPTQEGAVNDLAFYRVDVPERGKWAGYTFVKMIVGGQDPIRVPKAQATGILARIAADPDAGPRYGWEIGKCCRCNRLLTNDRSRTLGIGPECEKKGMM